MRSVSFNLTIKVMDVAKKKARTPEERQQAVIDDYKRAYKLVYGIYPTVVESGGYFRVAGQSVGVDLRRLKTMTTQLLNVHRSAEYISSSDKSPSRPIRMFRH